ncbi:hypothetical protein GGI20_000276 [Coemansia sp. BCRC 34301]|nr:hypothetical protein GGI20_000276 [Coemansia sp. BCRC 34301]
MAEQRRGRPKSAATALVADVDSAEESEGSVSGAAVVVAAAGEKRKRQRPRAGGVVASGGDSGCEEEAKPISAQEEADLSSALIAKLLAEDSGGSGRMGYYEDYGNGAGVGRDALDEYASGSEPDDEWDPSARGRRTSKSSKVRKQANGKAKQAPISDSERSEADEKDQRRGKKKHKAVAKKPRADPEPVVPGQFRSGAYTDDEERMFNEGLELFGRSWSEISGHVVTRDAKSIRSHAQKYFIKLFRDGVALPAKVKESGEGYTLSGRPLDPNSAAARPYLQHVMELDPPTPKAPRAPKATEAVTLNAGDLTVPAIPLPLKEADDSAEANDMALAKCGADTSDAPQTKCDAEASPATLTAAPASPVRTEYAMSRPQRSQARTVALHYDDPHQMVRCTAFQGQPLSGAPGSQPFRVVVHSNAQLQMDFHAHLMLAEVIGLLGGRWDAANRVLTVTRAFPCAALESEDAHTNVEMDPGSEVDVRRQIKGAGLRVVGWYHSHPTFRPDPSIIDIDNQTAYQKLFRDNDSAEEPFVGAIVGPYDPELPGPVSVFNWFYVGRSVVDRGLPKRLVVEPAPDFMLPVEEREMLLHLLDTACHHQHCAALEEAWRPSSIELRSLKMAVSLACRMPWLVAPAELAGETIPAHPLAVSPRAPPSGASDCAALGEQAALPVAEFETADKQISAADLLTGQRAVQDPLLAALGSRFSAGVFKTGPDGGLADAQALERVYAAYFMQWAATI